MTLSDFLARLSHPSRSGSGYVAFCPAHPDVNKKSLSVSQGDKCILVKCFAGCSVEKIVDAMGLGMKDLFSERGGRENAPGMAPARRPVPQRQRVSPAQTGASPVPPTPFTLAQLAAAKKLPEAFLYDLGVEDHPDGIGVVVGYFDANGKQHARYRLRTALSAKDGSKWLPAGLKAPAGVYGEWRLRDESKTKT